MSDDARKIVLRQRETGKFLCKDLGWTASIDEAKLFPTTYDAFKFASDNEFIGTEIVLRTGEPRYDVVLAGPTWPT